MDLALTEEQEMLKKWARDFLGNECPAALVRGMEEDEKGYSPNLWRKMANLGWMGLVIPEKYGGSGNNFLELTVLLEEMGRALLPGPFFSTTVFGALAVMAAGSEEQKGDILPKMANGEMLLTMALNEPDFSPIAAGISVSAKADKDEYVISGTKLFVLNAHVADQIVCVARTKSGGAPEDGVTMFLVDGKSPGVKVTVLDTAARDKHCEVIFDNVRVPKNNILGELDRGWPVVDNIMEQAAVAESARMLGGCQKVLEMTAEHAKTRVAFGHPIGMFQTVAHRTADQMIDTETSRHLIYLAAWQISEGLPFAREASVAKAYLSVAYRRVCTEAHQTLAGIGVMEDHDLQLYTRRAKVAEFACGDVPTHLERIAQEMNL